MAYYPLYYACDLNVKTVESLVVLTVMVRIVITIVPTPAFLGSFNAGVFIALHEIMGEVEINADAFGMVAWITYVFVVLVMGFFYVTRSLVYSCADTK